MHVDVKIGELYRHHSEQDKGFPSCFTQLHSDTLGKMSGICGKGGSEIVFIDTSLLSLLTTSVHLKKVTSVHKSEIIAV